MKVAIDGAVAKDGTSTLETLALVFHFTPSRIISQYALSKRRGMQVNISQFFEALLQPP